MNSKKDDVYLDCDRNERLAFPEIIYGEYKSLYQLEKILDIYISREENVFISRISKEKAIILCKKKNRMFYNEIGNTLSLQLKRTTKHGGIVSVVSAGTSDRFIVEEITTCLEFLGFSYDVFQDVGVAGIHRLEKSINAIGSNDVIIAVAGFEGALPSIIGGLIGKPVIGVPTSVGYGVSKGGKAALYSMLSSCANGISVMNIDNGIGSVFAAVRILNLLNLKNDDK